MSYFITNQKDQKTVAGRVKALIQHASELKFLVGFFYFSGWAELYEKLQANTDINLKLLVGLSVDELLGKTIEHANVRTDLTGEEKVDAFFDSLACALNNDQMDTEAFYNQVSFFLDMIEAGRLEIRKTLEPNHAKLYLFKAKAELGAWSCARFITGSSNLTKAGLRGQNEFNVEISDYGTEEAEECFDKLWQTALPITSDDARRKRLIDFVRHQSQAAEVTPFEAYTLMLKTYVELQELKQIKQQVVRLLEDRGYRPYLYQLDAVSQALTILDTYNGVVVADVVGLGKSVIASMIAKSLGRRGLILCPPGLMGDENGANGGWHKYRHDFKLYDWEVRSVGKLEETLEYVLSPAGEDIEVVIVDEVHRFRNQDTASYETLSHLCRGKKVILLTATPFNNSPADIFSMLKLFMVPGQSGITLDEDLEIRFSFYNVLFQDLSYISRHYNSPDSSKRVKAEQLYVKVIEEDLPVDINLVRQASHNLAAEIRAILEPILIRRNRIDLQNDYAYRSEVTEIPTLRDPEELFFALDRSQAQFYQNVIGSYFGENGEFSGAIYQPFNYEGRTTGSEVEDVFVRTSQRNLYEFMRRLLVKRFESSFGAFYDSIVRFHHLHEIVLTFIDKSGGLYVLDRRLIEKMYEADEDEILTALNQFAQNLENLEDQRERDKIYKLDEFQEKDEFLNDIRSDLSLFQRIKEMLDMFGLVNNDPKRDRLVDEIRSLRSEDTDRKIIIFTEYMDTVSHLKPVLEEVFPSQVLAISGGGLSHGMVKRINLNFDASIDAQRQHDEYQILIASDKLSEGFNLNRAGAIINYDIPWNPTRVIQRVGRINRIGKKVFDELYLYNFFPTEQGADVVHSREIAAQKMFLIHNILGEDSKIFDPEEEPSPAELYKRINRNPEQMEEASLLTQTRNRLAEIHEAHPDIQERIKKLPARVKTAKHDSMNEVVVLQRKALGLFVQQVTDDGAVKEITFEEMLPHVECTIDEPRLELTTQFWPAYQRIKDYRPIHKKPHTENSVETKAFNNLNCIVRQFPQKLAELTPFARTLIRDIREYHTLSKYTLRLLARFDIQVNSPESKIVSYKKILEELRRLLGEDYLSLSLHDAKQYDKKIIVAVENQK